MKAVSNHALAGLLLCLCALCGWQWHREMKLREMSIQDRTELASALKQREELEVRVKAADAEILRLTEAVNHLRANPEQK